MRVHSRYVRTATALLMALGYVSVFRSPSAGFSAILPPVLGVSRAERLGEALPAFAWRTNRLGKALCAIAFAAGGEGGACLAHAQAMPASPHTLLCELSFSPLSGTSSLRMGGINEWGATRSRTWSCNSS
jgi:hypothetical protein